MIWEDNFRKINSSLNTYLFFSLKKCVFQVQTFKKKRKEKKKKKDKLSLIYSKNNFSRYIPH